MRFHSKGSTCSKFKEDADKDHAESNKPLQCTMTIILDWFLIGKDVQGNKVRRKKL